MWNKLQGWQAKLLSQVGKEVLLKTVAQAIPLFNLHEFLFTADVLMPRVRENVELILVGLKNEWGKAHSLDQMGYPLFEKGARRYGFSEFSRF